MIIDEVCNKVKFNLSNVRYIRNFLSSAAAELYLHSMVLSHINYCLRSCSDARSAAPRPLDSLHKQALRTLDNKPFRYHHCHIVQKYNLFSWENLIVYKNICLVYKITRGLAPPPLAGFISLKSTSTRGLLEARLGETAPSHLGKVHLARLSFIPRIPSMEFNTTIYKRIILLHIQAQCEKVAH